MFRLSGQFLNLTPEQLSFLFLASVLGASLMGSLHCVGMCGPLTALQNEKPKQLYFYHFFRWISYVSLGVLFSYFGQKIFKLAPDWLIILTGLLMFGVMVYFSYRFLFPNGKSFHFSPKFTSWSQKILKPVFGWQRRSPYFFSSVLGIMTPFIPCGWLYGFVAASALAGDPFQSATVMTVFWIGTVPALTVIPTLIRSKTIGRSNLLRVSIAIALVLSASWILYARVQAGLAFDAGGSCH